ncbi:hypothetical protein AVEN_149329-1, partial [Araneus ventricosus]
MKRRVGNGERLVMHACMSSSNECHLLAETQARVHKMYKFHTLAVDVDINKTAQDGVKQCIYR